MATFADRLLVHLSDPASLPAFLTAAGLDAFLTAEFQRRFNTEFWQVRQVVVGGGAIRSLEQPLWRRQRILGREEQQGPTPIRTTVDHAIYGSETVLWVDATVDLDTTWTVDQFPGTVDVSPASPVSFDGIVSLVSVLRVDAGNHPLDRAGAALATVTVDDQGRLRTDPPNPVTLRLDAVGGVLLRPDGTVHAPVLLELFPRLGPAARGVPLGADGQPLRDLRMDAGGGFTDLDGAPAQTDPTTGLPIDGSGRPARPARASPAGGTVDHRFLLSLPVRTDQLVLNLVTRLHLFAAPALDLLTDLREVLAARQVLEQGTDYLTSLDAMDNKIAQAFALVYDQDVLDGNGLDPAGVRRLGARTGVLVQFFSIP